jgi:hypothetical protein
MQFPKIKESTASGAEFTHEEVYEHQKVYV